ncbi:MAG: hypothetical protein Kow0059_01050 [Candidatus Sumerlaeia bacterium]
MATRKSLASLLLSLFIIALGLALTTVYVATWHVPELKDRVTAVFGDPDDKPSTYTIAYTVAVSVLTGAAALAYLLSFTRQAERRPRVRLTLMWMTIGAAWSGLLVGGFEWDDLIGDYGLLATVTVVTILAPLVLWPLELGVRNASAALGKAALKYNSPLTAKFFLSVALYLPPCSEDLEKAFALALCECGQVEGALVWLEKFWNREGRPLETRLLAYLAFYYKEAGRLDEAVAAYEELYRRREGHRAIGQDLVSLYLKRSELPNALRVLRRIGDFSDLGFLVYFIKLLRDTGEFDEALRHCRSLADKEGAPFEQTRQQVRQIIEKAPDHEEAWRLLAELALKVEDKEEAIEALERVDALRSGDEAAAAQLKTLYRDTFQFLKLEKLLRRLARKNIQDPDVQHELVETLIQNQHFDDAQQELEQLVVAFPRDYRFWAALANLLYRKQEFISARDALVNAMEHCPLEKQNPLVFLKNKIFSALMNTELRRYQRAVEENPKDPQVRFQLVEQLMQNNFPERAATEIDELIYLNTSCKPQAVEFVETLVKRYPNSFVLMNYLADLFLRDKRYGDAFQLYLTMREHSLHPDAVLTEGCERILQLAPDYAPAIRCLGDLALSRGDKEMTVQYYQRYLELTPSLDEDSSQQLTRALFYALIELGRLTEAERYGRELLRLEPGDAGHFKAMGDIAESQHRLDEALEFFKKAEELAPDDYALAKRRKEVENAQKKERIEKLKAILEESEDNLPARLELGDMLFYFKDYNGALYHYQKAEKLPGGHIIGKAKVGYTLALKGLDSIADEHLEKARLDAEHLTGAEAEQLKEVIYEAGKYYESIRDYVRALEYYKQIFNADAAYRDIVERLERIEPKAARAKKFTRH